MKQSEQYQLVIRSLSDRIVEAQAPIRVLDAIKWDDGIRDTFIPLASESTADGAYGPGGHPRPEERDYSLAIETAKNDAPFRP